MPDQFLMPSVPLTGEERRRQFTATLPMRTALLAVAAVWLLGAVWSYTEQSAFAANKGFAFPHLLPLVIDGFAVAMAGVAWAASLDARPAVAARLATVVAVCASSASNGAWAWIRSNRDLVAVLLGVAVPIAANLAFEVLLAELRRQVQRRRGLPPPAAVPYPRLIRLALAPWRTFVEWRAMVLDLTAMDRAVAAPARPASGRPHPTVAAPVLPTLDPPAPAVPSSGPPAPTLPTPGPPAPTLPTPDSPAPAPPTSGRRAPAVATSGRAAPTLPNPSAPKVGLPAGERTPTATGAAATSVSTHGKKSRPIGTNGSPANGSPANGSRTNGPPANGSRISGAGAGGSGAVGTGAAARLSLDSRVEMLARHLVSTEDADEITGDMVGPLLGIEVAPRTGRRLLGQARELVAARAETDGHDPGLRVIGAG